MTQLPEWARPDSQAATPPLDEFRRLYDEDDNLWWRVECGHHQNLFEAACEQIDELTTRVERLREAKRGLDQMHRQHRESLRRELEQAQLTSDPSPDLDPRGET